MKEFKKIKINLRFNRIYYLTLYILILQVSLIYSLAYKLPFHLIKNNFHLCIRVCEKGILKVLIIR